VEKSTDNIGSSSPELPVDSTELARELAKLPHLAVIFFASRCILQGKWLLWGAARKEEAWVVTVDNVLALAKQIALTPSKLASSAFRNEVDRLYNETHQFSSDASNTADEAATHVMLAAFHLTESLRTARALAALLRKKKLANATGKARHLCRVGQMVLEEVLTAVPRDRAKMLRADLVQSLRATQETTKEAKQRELVLHKLQPMRREDFEGIARRSEDGILPPPMLDTFPSPQEAGETASLERLRAIKRRVLTAIAAFRDEFRGLVGQLQGTGCGKKNPELAAEFNALLDLLGFDLYVTYPKNRGRLHRAYLRSKSVPGLAGGALEARAQIDGEQRSLSSRVVLPENMVVKERPGTHVPATTLPRKSRRRISGA
jgi:hypothetical protein